MVESLDVFAGVVTGYALTVLAILIWGAIQGRESRRRKPKMYGKVENPKEVVCANPDGLLKVWRAETVQGSPGVKEAARSAGGYLASVFEKAGCSCKPYRDELKELDNKRRVLNAKIAEIDSREHPILDRLAVATSGYVQEWLQEQVAAGRFTKDQLDYAYQSDGQPLAEHYAADVIGGWLPRIMRPVPVTNPIAAHTDRKLAEP